MFAIVRLRGEVNLRPEIKSTLAMLHIHRVNHCIVVKEDPHYRGMIQKVKDYVAWGKIDDDTLALLLEKRGRLSANRRLTEQFLKENTSYSSFKELASCHQLRGNKPEGSGNQAHLQVASGPQGFKDHQEDRATGRRSGISHGSGGSYQEDEVEPWLDQRRRKREGIEPTTASIRMRAEAGLAAAVEMSGKCKHHFMRSMLLGTQMGKHGFVKLPLSEELEVVNVDVLDQMAGPDGKIELSEMKVLGRGKVTRSLTLARLDSLRRRRAKLRLLVVRQ